jgi:hypothetical protein
MTFSKLRVENEEAGSSFMLGFVKFPPHCMTSDIGRHYVPLPPAKVRQSTNSIQPSRISIAAHLLKSELTLCMSR